MNDVAGVQTEVRGRSRDGRVWIELERRAAGTTPAKDGRALVLISGVRLIERVSVDARLLMGVEDHRGRAAHDVDLVSHRFKVVGIYARTVAAKVVDLKGRIERALEDQIRQPVGVHVATPELETTVSRRRFTTGPSPTTITAGDLGIETGDGCWTCRGC